MSLDMRVLVSLGLCLTLLSELSTAAEWDTEREKAKTTKDPVRFGKV